MCAQNGEPAGGKGCLIIFAMQSADLLRGLHGIGLLLMLAGGSRYDRQKA